MEGVAMQHRFLEHWGLRWAASVTLLFGVSFNAQSQTQGLPLIHHADAESVDWRQANDAVGQFLRGHIDLLRWEQQNALAATSLQTAPGKPLALAQALAWARQGQPQWVARANASAIERQQLQRQAQAAGLELERAWVQAVVAQQALRYQSDVLEATAAGAELARRMAQIGNWSRAQYVEQEVLHQQAQAEYALAQHQAHSAVLALWEQLHQPQLAPQTLAASLPFKLPELPRWSAPMPSAPAELIAMAQTQHPNWPSLQAHVLQAKRALSARQLQQLETVLTTLSQSDLSTGPAQWPREVPLSHSAEQALNTLAQHAQLDRHLTASVNRAWHRWSTAQKLANTTMAELQRHHMELEEAAVQHYNGMLKSTWDLLASTRARIEAVKATLNAQQQAWLAHIALRGVLAGLPDAGDGLSSATNAPTTAKPH
jgi:hypothetical protein